MTENENRGKSLLEFPDTYVVLDLETTGLSPIANEITEIGIEKVINRKKISSFQQLVKPINKIPPYIENLTGISNEMVENQPRFEAVLDQISSFINDDLVVGQNVRFDVSFLYDNFLKSDKYFTNSYVDTLRISRIILPDMKHNLEALVNHFEIKNDLGYHRALADAENTRKVYECLRSLVEEKYGSTSEFKKHPKVMSRPHQVKEKTVTPVEDISVFINIDRIKKI
ncbi:MAG: 3'-5' exonuclease [Bacilli bacterium]|jgi:DNA polymerase-3 subunit epsilon